MPAETASTAGQLCNIVAPILTRYYLHFVSYTTNTPCPHNLHNVTYTAYGGRLVRLQAHTLLALCILLDNPAYINVML